MTANSGKAAVDRGNGYSHYDSGMCLQWVRGPCWDIGSYFGSAIDAWNGAKNKHPGDRSAPIGAPLFYRGGNYGHVVIAKPNAAGMRSTDCRSGGVVSDEAISWVEKNWGYTYLGWTGDLNGVTLPLDSGNGNEDDMPQYDHANRKTDIALKNENWSVIEWENVPSGPAFHEGEAGCRIGSRAYSAVLHVTIEAPQGATIRMRCTEYDPDTGKDEETNPQTEALATSGTTYATHAQLGHVASGRRLRFHVACTQGGKVLGADAAVLSW